MASLTFLGTSAAVPSIGHDNTYMCVETETGTLLIDCAGSPLLKMQLAGIDPARLQHIIFTHRHPDHMYGYPILVLGLWLLGVRSALHVWAEPATLRTSEQLLELFKPDEWPGFTYPQYHEVDLRSGSTILDLPDLLITACATDHLVASIGLRLLNPKSGRSIVYSGDTAPSPRLTRLAHGTDLLIHEAAGALPGHSTASQAATVAASAGAGALYLIHYPSGEMAGLCPSQRGGLSAMVTEARKEFSGRVELARDFGVLDF